ncbi:hypothetical protein HCA55_10360 [Listeria booriae]|uniref:Bacterial Ig domain-containing protein n=1 Tax=Listeria booriae TaxID=1552123 RepID=A0A842B5C3_9LIST|nr:Ig-like domain-containing protein [Listeria booriae]MBC1797132.1 hypothetical protein [Listeria booriae]MBC1801228.1 hypothetical protein [Listeria booriae]MBC1811716.1 hypothetical protein [Listeria booriae]
MKKKALLWVAGLAATTGGALGFTDNETQVRAAENNIISQSVTPTEVSSTSSRGLFAESVDSILSEDRSLQITEGFNLGSTSISGVGTPGKEVSISYLYQSAFVTTRVDDQGKWQAIIPRLEVGQALFLIDSGIGGKPAFAIYELWPSKLTERNFDKVTTNTNTVTGSGGYPGVELEVEFSVKVGNQLKMIKSSGIVDQDGNFEIPIVNQAVGDYAISAQQKWNGAIFGETGSTGYLNFFVKVVEGIEKPTVNAVSGKETKVTGKGKQGAKVRVQASGQEIGTATVDQNGIFEVTIPAQKMGNELQITQEEDKDVSESTKVIVEQEVPEVTSELKEGMTTISGTASPGADVAVWTGAVAPVANVKSDVITGQWTATVPALIGGNTVQVSASLGLNQIKASVRYGIELGGITELRAIISGERVKVTGSGSPGATLNVRAGGNLVGTTTVNDTGKFELLIMRTVEGEKLSVSQTKNGLNSVVVETLVLKGIDAPSNIDIVTANSTKVSGKGKPGATVSVKVNGQEIGTGQVKDDGSFEVTIPSQLEGTKLSITQKDGGDESAAVVVTVISAQLTKPTIDDYYVNAAYIRGTAPAGAVRVTLTIDGKVTKIGTISADGKYMIYANDVAALKVAGANFEIFVTDANGQRSEVAMGTVKGLSSLVVNPYRAGQANVTGTVEDNVERIAVYDKAGTILRYGQINADGTFRIYVSGFAAMQVAGDNFTVRALNSTGIIAQATATILP